MIPVKRRSLLGTIAALAAGVIAGFLPKIAHGETATKTIARSTIYSSFQCPECYAHTLALDRYFETYICDTCGAQHSAFDVEMYDRAERVRQTPHRNPDDPAWRRINS